MKAVPPEEGPSDFRRLHRVFIGLFLLSGAAGLIYEVLWVRQFVRVFGASTYAVTIVLVAFMFGLGAGSWGVGRLVDTLSGKSLIRMYAGLEAGVGAYAIVLPYLLGWMENVYVGFYRLNHPEPFLFNGFKLLMAFSLLILPTVLLGATLPVLSRYVIRSGSSIALGVSRLYAVNTLGAIVGTVSTGYFLLPHLGIRLTNLLAAGISFLVAAAFLLLSIFVPEQREDAANPQSSGEKPLPLSLSRIQKAVLAGFCISGASAMLYEVAWTRILCMILGTTTYAFTTMLATFLLGIAIGSGLYRLIPPSIDRLRIFVGLQTATAFFVLLTIPGFEKLPFAYLSLHSRWVDSWADAQFLRFFLAAAVMLIPTVAMGILFPVVSSILIEARLHMGRRLGRAYAINTFGAAAGAAVGGLLLIPWIGMQSTIVAGALFNFAAGAGVYLVRGDIPIRRRMLATSAAGMAACLILAMTSSWAPRIMNSGTYLYAPSYEKMLNRYQKAASEQEAVPAMSDWSVWKLAMEQYSLLYYKAGVEATVSVMERADGVRFLTINGKTDASTGMKSDLRTQVMIGQLPLLFHPEPDKVLIVGLGSGITAGSVLTHDVRLVDCAEISPSVVKASGYFAEANGHALSDPRLKVEAQDARNMLLTSEKHYDVIISQPSNPWISGESSLFSLEWYRMVREHLEDGGLFLQWVPKGDQNDREKH